MELLVERWVQYPSSLKVGNTDFLVIKKGRKKDIITRDCFNLEKVVTICNLISLKEKAVAIWSEGWGHLKEWKRVQTQPVRREETWLSKKGGKKDVITIDGINLEKVVTICNLISLKEKVCEGWGCLKEWKRVRTPPVRGEERLKGPIAPTDNQSSSDFWVL